MDGLMDGLECDVREIGYDVREIWIYCILIDDGVVYCTSNHSSIFLCSFCAMARAVGVLMN
jgi:hypothetical protein